MSSISFPDIARVVAVRVHLDQLEILPVNVPVQEVIIKFQHPQLGQLIYRDS